MTKSTSVSSPYSTIKSTKNVFEHTFYGVFVERPAFITCWFFPHSFIQITGMLAFQFNMFFVCFFSI